MCGGQMDITISGLKLYNKKNSMVYGKKRAFKSADVKCYERDLLDEINGQWRGAPIKGPVHLILDITFPDRRRRDVHNFCDIICDVLQGVAYDDDSQIEKIEMNKYFGKDWELRIICKEKSSNETHNIIRDILRQSA
jgi:Holliday junction resolvase RusA-like endonuclease